ncbi:MAG: phosphatidate cytidylyltransferase [Anaerolineae bacterium]|nr:phosphatidate cytidylyltransferase [Anaerolineae bacterium]
MLQARFVSALVLLPLVVVLVIVGGWVYALAVILFLTIGGHEYVGAMRAGGYHPYHRLLMLTIVLIGLGQAAGFLPGLLAPALTAFLVVAMLAMLASYSDGDHLPTINYGITVTGALYIGWLGGHIIAIRQLPDGLYWTLIAALCTGFADVGAYLVGRAVGRHPMAPIVSPSKTWEGYLGGAITAAGCGALVGAFSAASGAAITPAEGALLGLVAGIVSPAGDLAMSTFKRMVKIKNFSNLIPGHGGMLDRLDSVLVGVTVCYYVIVYLLRD